MPKATTQWPACVVHSSLIDPESSALTIKPPSIHETSKSQQIITKEIKDHESLWRIYHHQKSFFFCQSRVMHLIPWNWSVRTRQRSSPVIGQFRMNNIFPFFMKCSVTVDLRNVFFTQCLKLSFCKRVSVVKHYLRSHMAHSSQA